MRNGNVLWNVMGLGLPLVMAAFAIPGLLSLIGPERFGFLALAWGLIGYAGALDLGIGRATTQRVSALRGSAERDHIPDVLATAVRVTLLTGTVGMFVIVMAAVGGVHELIQTTTVPVREIEISMLLLALALPMQALSATYRGVNEAYLNFRGINVLRILLGVTNFGAPYVVSLYSTKVYWLVATLVLSRFLGLAFYRYLARRCMLRAQQPERGRYAASHAQSLLRFGGWFSITSVVGPLMVQSDRFFVGGLISAEAVTFYVIPYEISINALILVGAVTTVIFPAVTNLLHSSPQEAQALFRLWLLRVCVLMLLCTVALAYAMPTLLRLWVGQHIGIESIYVGQILCIGVFFNAVGGMYFAYLHAHGRVKATAIQHLVELPVYIFLLITLIGLFGITGCAVAWVLRTAANTAVLMWMSKRIESRNGVTSAAL